jgi:hypothetical protein
MIERAKKSLSGVLTWVRALPASVWVLGTAAIAGAFTAVVMVVLARSFIQHEPAMPVPSEVES